MATAEFSVSAVSTTILERARDAVGCGTGARYHPNWHWVAQDSRFTWLMDGDRAVLLLDRDGDTMELRCGDPHDDPPADDIPMHYHEGSIVGVRLGYAVALPNGGARKSVSVETFMEGEQPLVAHQQRWEDGSIAESVARIRYDKNWGSYTVAVETRLRARDMSTMVEFCRVVPAGIGDSRSGVSRYPFSYWSYRRGVRKMMKNPLWFCSYGAQDAMDERYLQPGGFVGFGPDARMNPVVELRSSESPVGGRTDDVSQEESLVLLPPASSSVRATGWWEMGARYRLFSIPRKLAQRMVEAAEYMDPGPMMAGKFRSSANVVLPPDLSGISLPGSPFIGTADWSQPVPWDAPFDGQLWMASADSTADVSYSRDTGYPVDGAICIKAAGTVCSVSPGSGHLRRVDAGVTYRFAMWIRTEDRVEAWIECQETLFIPGDKACHRSPSVASNTDWTLVEVVIKGRGDDAPFANTALCVSGHGRAWFSGMSFLEVKTVFGPATPRST